MTRFIATRRVRMALLPMLFLAACGSGDIDGSGADSGSMQTSSRGSANEFGSVVVNGQRFGTASASVHVDGQPTTTEALEIGQILDIVAINDGEGALQAQSIRYQPDLVGKVDAVDAATATLGVAGQRVVISAATILDDVALEAPLLGTAVSVSGLRRADGVIIASYVGRAQAASPTVVSGPVATLDVDATTLSIGDIEIDYSAAATVPARLSVGSRVRAAGLFAGAVLQADRLDPLPARQPVAGAEVRIEGFVTATGGSDGLEVDTTPIRIDDATVMPDAGSSELATGNLVQVIGMADGEGRVLATRITRRTTSQQQASTRISAPAARGDDGALLILGRPLVTTELTRIRDARDGQRPFNADTIAAGDRLDIAAIAPTEDGVFSAVRIERVAPATSSAVTLQAIVERIDDFELTLAGMTVTTDSANFGEGGSQTREVFFEGVSVGDTVLVQGSFDGQRIQAQSVVEVPVTAR